jgi:Sulfotransferase family
MTVDRAPGTRDWGSQSNKDRGSEPPILFINGFHRSGTTAITFAATDALGGITTTVGHLARHIPTLERFLDPRASGSIDRGVDRLEANANTPEEYGFLLYNKTGRRALYGSRHGVTLLRRHIEELAAEAPGIPVILKNPWDTGQEARLLADFPTAGILLVRRNLPDLERSAIKAIERAVSARAYPLALDGVQDGKHWLDSIVASRWKKALLLRLTWMLLHGRVRRLSRSAASLPMDRVAFLSYDEMCEDPYRAATWAAHLIEPQTLAEAFIRHAFPERSAAAPGGKAVRRLDTLWNEGWRRARAMQLAAGVITGPPPTAP